MQLKFFKQHKDLTLAFIVTVAVIALGLFLGWDNNRTVPVYIVRDFHYLLEPSNPLQYTASWDGSDYLYIAQKGYDSLFWVNWLPLYPITIFLLSHIIPSFLYSGLLIAWASLIGAAYFYIKIIRKLFKIKSEDTSESLKALTFFVLYPTGVFLIVPFSESLYAFLALGAIYCALNKRWLAAAIYTLFCAACHATGIFIIALVVLILWEEKVKLKHILYSFIISSLGLLSYMTYLFIRFGKPLAFIESQQTYHDWTHFGLLNLLGTPSFMNVITVVLLVIGICYWWKRRKSFAFYLLCFFVILIIGKQYGGFNRYALMAFPVQFMLYEYFKDKKIYPYVTALLGVMWTYFTLRYMGGYIGS